MEPLFIDLGGPAGTGAPRTRFVMFYRGAQPPRAVIVHAPALAEEMNKSRRMVALQARALADLGCAVLVPDLLGCGESPGDFGNATWDDWVDDVASAARWMQQHGAREGGAAPPLVLWGMRAGALLAAQAAARLGDVRALLLWHPAPAGRPLLQQFMRLATAAAWVPGPQAPGPDAPDGTAATGAVREAARPPAADEPIEIAGYTLSPGLRAGLGAARLSAPQGVQHALWLECSPRAEATLAPAGQSVRDALQAAGCAVDARVVNGPAFWQTTEIEEAPALIDATTAAVTAWLASRPH
jgi:exosortase A-associated hydrolase 2